MNILKELCNYISPVVNAYTTFMKLVHFVESVSQRCDYFIIRHIGQATFSAVIISFCNMLHTEIVKITKKTCTMYRMCLTAGYVVW